MLCNFSLQSAGSRFVHASLATMFNQSCCDISCQISDQHMITRKHNSLKKKKNIGDAMGSSDDELIELLSCHRPVSRLAFFPKC